MTMGSEDELFASLALPVVIKPILEKLESKDANAVKSLRAGFNKVEAQHPGFTLNLIRGILKKAEIENQVDLSECFLRLERSNNSNEFLIDRPEESLRLLNSRSVELKRILGRIPDEIFDRKKFLETIKEIASSIRLLLDSVNTILVMVTEHQKHSVDYRKKEFVKYSRNFSNTLKDFFRDNELGTLADDFSRRLTWIKMVELRRRNFVRCSRRFSSTLKAYFRDNRKQCVFLSANHLINQSNILMKTIKEALL